MIDLKKKLEAEIATLEHELRHELPKAILTARAHGDLRENAEFKSAKERQSFVDARLSQLKKRLADFSLIDLRKIPHDRIGLGSTVEVFDSTKDEKITYKLVTSEEADAANGMISTTSPIGRGLLNKKVGDEIKIQIPGGMRELEVLSLKTIYDTVE